MRHTLQHLSPEHYLVVLIPNHSSSGPLSLSIISLVPEVISEFICADPFLFSVEEAAVISASRFSQYSVSVELIVLIKLALVGVIFSLVNPL